jgi:hypothetical protein
MLRYYRYIQQGSCSYCGINIDPELPIKHWQKEELEHTIPYPVGVDILGRIQSSLVENVTIEKVPRP